MLVAGDVQIQLLLPHALDLGLEIAANSLQVVAALTNVAVNLGKMLAQLLARLRQAIQGRRCPRLQLRQLPAQVEDLLPARLQFGRAGDGLVLRLLPLQLEGDALGWPALVVVRPAKRCTSSMCCCSVLYLLLLLDELFAPVRPAPSPALPTPAEPGSDAIRRAAGPARGSSPARPTEPPRPGGVVLLPPAVAVSRSTSSTRRRTCSCSAASACSARARAISRSCSA